ncbi:MAG TPA: hypothetical protein PK322_11815 [Opitutaceae bacterium]|nr:hypothetical protein [Opitutaceae bacterium]
MSFFLELNALQEIADLLQKVGPCHRVTGIVGALCAQLCAYLQRRTRWTLCALCVRRSRGGLLPGDQRRGADPWQLRHLVVQAERRHIGVDLRRQVRVGVPEQLLSGALIDPVAHAERLPGLAERMKVQHAAEPVHAFDARPFEIAAQDVVGRPRVPEHRPRRQHALRLQFPQRLDQLPPQRHGALVLVLRRVRPEQRERLRLVEMQVGPHQRPHLRFPLPGVEQHLVGELPFASDGEEPLQLVLRERPRETHLFPAHLDMADLRQRVDEQPLRLDEPVEERRRREVVLLLGLRRARQARAPFHKRVRTDLADDAPPVVVDHLPDARCRVAHMLRLQLAAPQVRLVLVDEDHQRRARGLAHDLRRDDALLLSLLLDDEVPEPFLGRRTVGRVQRHGDGLVALVEAIAAAEQARLHPFAFDHATVAENVSDHGG